jgi:hypothetical protein
MLDGGGNHVIFTDAAVNTTNDHLNHQSQLFTVRVWVEALGNDQTEVRGEVQHVLSGETHYFRRWSKLVEFLTARFPESHNDWFADPDDC